jgi:hypothetical protein
VDKYYTFCGGSKPGAPPAAVGGGDDLGALLDAEEAIDFNPNEMNVEKSILDIDLDDISPPKPKVAPGEWDPNADTTKMTMPEQLQW